MGNQQEVTAVSRAIFLELRTDAEKNSSLLPCVYYGLRWVPCFFPTVHTGTELQWNLVVRGTVLVVVDLQFLGRNFKATMQKVDTNSDTPLGADAGQFCAPPGTLTLDIPTSVIAEFPTVEIVCIAQAASILESAALLLVPVIVEPGDDGLTRSLVQGQEAGL